MFSFTVTPRTDFSASGGERFLQSPFWAAFKSRHGWKSLFFDVRTEGCETFTVSVLVRRFGKFFSIAYIPMMPFFSKKANGAFGEKGDAESFAFDECGEDGGSAEAGENADAVSYAYFLSEFSEALKPFLPKHTLCIRFDPAIDFYSLASRNLFAASLRKAAASEKLSIVKTKTDIQPPDTTIVDLTKSENELLGASGATISALPKKKASSFAHTVRMHRGTISAFAREIRRAAFLTIRRKIARSTFFTNCIRRPPCVTASRFTQKNITKTSSR